MCVPDCGLKIGVWAQTPAPLSAFTAMHCKGINNRVLRKVVSKGRKDNQRAKGWTKERDGLRKGMD